MLAKPDFCHFKTCTSPFGGLIFTAIIESKVCGLIIEMIAAFEVMMDLVERIFKFSFTLHHQEVDPLKDGMRFFIVEVALTPPADHDTESNTTVDGVDMDEISTTRYQKE